MRSELELAGATVGATNDGLEVDVVVVVVVDVVVVRPALVAINIE